MSILDGYTMEPMVGDPDDHRPNTRWSLTTDPGDDRGRVDSLAIIREAIAILDGEGVARLGDERRQVRTGAVVFIPAGTPHGTVNGGATALEILAVFPSTTIEIAMLERNPAPGTEGDAPRRSRYDLRTGDVEPLPGETIDG